MVSDITEPNVFAYGFFACQVQTIAKARLDGVANDSDSLRVSLQKQLYAVGAYVGDLHFYLPVTLSMSE
jgi:hypothetical protein